MLAEKSLSEAETIRIERPPAVGERSRKKSGEQGDVSSEQGKRAMLREEWNTMHWDRVQEEGRIITLHRLAG